MGSLIAIGLLIAIAWLDVWHRRQTRLYEALCRSQAADIETYRTRIWELEREIKVLRIHLGETMSREEVWS